jgi:hypothetical protein
VGLKNRGGSSAARDDTDAFFAREPEINFTPLPANFQDKTSPDENAPASIITTLGKTNATFQITIFLIGPASCHCDNHLQPLGIWRLESCFPIPMHQLCLVASLMARLSEKAVTEEERGDLFLPRVLLLGSLRIC